MWACPQQPQQYRTAEVVVEGMPVAVAARCRVMAAAVCALAVVGLPLLWGVAPTDMRYTQPAQAPALVQRLSTHGSLEMRHGPTNHHAPSGSAPPAIAHRHSREARAAPPVLLPAAATPAVPLYPAAAVAALAVFALQVVARRPKAGGPPLLSVPPSAPNVHSIWANAEAAGYGDTLCAVDEHHGKPGVRLTYSQMRQQITTLCGALQTLGVRKGTKLGLFAENSARWLAMDQAVMMGGACSAVRGAAAPVDELHFILEDSEASFVVVETAALLETLLADMPPALARNLKGAAILFEKDPAETQRLELEFQRLAQESGATTAPRVHSFEALLALGAGAPCEAVEVRPQDLATLVYTSGTTGKPKGAMLTHANLLTEVLHVTFHEPWAKNTEDPRPGHVFVTILPCWHVYERATEYWMLGHGVTLVYTTKKRLKADLASHRPHYLILVPRILELLHSGIQNKLKDKPPFLRRVIAFLTAVSRQYMKARRVLTGTDLYMNIRFPDGAGLLRLAAALLTMVVSYPLVALADVMVWKKIREATGGRVKAACCGGASLPMYLEDFFEMAGLPVLVGYGLTETSPVIASRRLERNIKGTCGRAMACTLRVVDEQTGEPLPPLTPGVVRVKGTQVFQGYYRNPEATEKAFDSYGFFDTGDTGYLLKTGELVVSGRVKDIIVLSNGENIEPAPVEDAIMSSALVDQVMLVGQGQRGLGALVVPSLPALVERGLVTAADGAAAEAMAAAGDSEGLAKLAARLGDQPDFWKALHREINLQVKGRKGYRPEEQVVDFKLILTPFSVENQQLTQTLKVKRNVVEQHYDTLVGSLFK